MSDPVIVFLLAVACLLAAGAATRPLFQRTGVPEALWLVGLGVALRATGLVPDATIAALAPYFAALALVIVLFEAGRELQAGAPRPVTRRSLQLALAGAAATVPLVVLFSMALYGLELLPIWSWTHAIMLGALLTCAAPEVFTPSLRAAEIDPEAIRVLERESAITGALAIAGTAVCIDLLSLEVGEGEALAAIAAGFGLGLAFGTFAGLLWISAVRLLAEGRRIYPFTLAGVIALYVFTEALGGIGALAVLVFGAIVGNAAAIVERLFRPRGAAAEAQVGGDDFAAALDEHANTVAILRVLMFTFMGLGLGRPWGLLVMGVALGLLLVVARLAAGRAVLRGLDERTAAALAASAPRGMAVAALAALPYAAAVPGTQSLTTLVFAAAVTTCAAFSVGIRHGQRAAAWVVRPTAAMAARGGRDAAAVAEPGASSPEGHVATARVYGTDGAEDARERSGGSVPGSMAAGAGGVASTTMVAPVEAASGEPEPATGLGPAAGPIGEPGPGAGFGAGPAAGRADELASGTGGGAGSAASGAGELASGTGPSSVTGRAEEPASRPGATAAGHGELAPEAGRGTGAAATATIVWRAVVPAPAPAGSPAGQGSGEAGPVGGHPDVLSPGTGDASRGGSRGVAFFAPPGRTSPPAAPPERPSGPPPDAAEPPLLDVEVEAPVAPTLAEWAGFEKAKPPGGG